MDGIRISATDLDAYRRFRSEEDADLASLLAQLRRQSPPTEAMEAGSALHLALEKARPGEAWTTVVVGEYRFFFDLDGTVDLPPIREMKATRDYTINGVQVTFVGKVDAIHGKRVDDHKFTAHFDAERFLGSYQWRAYLDIFGADEFRWNVFEGRETEPKTYIISAMHPLTMHRYPGMADDLRRELARFVDFARDHLPERFAPAVQNLLMAG